jgi:hypothetical protein
MEIKGQLSPAPTYMIIFSVRGSNKFSSGRSSRKFTVNHTCAHHEGVSGSGGNATVIFKFGPRWRTLDSFKPKFL